MVSLYMPDVQVEIAFTSTFATPAASRVWTDVSTYVELHEGMDIDIGRQDEMSVADANTLTLTLDNTDGRFTALRAASPYYPNVKIGRPIRVKVTPPGGTVSTRFVGFIDEWPVEWDGSDAYAKARITASTRMSRLGLTARLKSMIEQEILDASPIAYYTFGDPSGSTSASESSANSLQVGPMAPLASTSWPGVATFGNAVGVANDGLTAMELPVDAAYLVNLPGVTVRSLRICYRAEASNNDPFAAYARRSTGAASLMLNATAAFASPPYSVQGGALGSTLKAGAATSGTLHDIVVTSSVADGTRVYLDGAQVITGAGTDFTDVKDVIIFGGAVTTVLCHVAIYDTILTPTQIAAQANAALTGFSGERTDQRLLRILDMGGVASTEVVAEIGAETMTYQQTRGMSVVDVLRECESTEGGVLFDGADGQVKFHNRSRRYLKTPSATLNMASQHVGSDYAPRLDRSALVNDVTVENPTTGETARAVDTTSSDEYGIATGSATSVANSYDPLQQKASWTVASYAEPRMRVPSLTVDVLAHQGLTPSAATLLGITVGDIIAVTNAPTQADTTSPSYFVEGYTESIGPESYFITYNLSPAHPALSTLVLDDATRGLLDTGILAY